MLVYPIESYLLHLARRARTEWDADHPPPADARRPAGLGLPSDATAHICGPTAFVADRRTALGELGIAPERMHTELFGALAPINLGVTDVRPAGPHPPPGPEGTGPQITVVRSGLTVRWAERYGSLLELADACEVPTRYSCRTGVCHTCITPLLSGDVSYSPDPLEAPADGTVLVCCARPGSDVVLDM